MVVLLRWGRGSGLSPQPVDWLVKKAICRKCPILHAYYSSSLFHLDLPLVSDISRGERTKKFVSCHCERLKKWCSELLLGKYLPRLNSHIWFPKAKWLIEIR